MNWPLDKAMDIAEKKGNRNSFSLRRGMSKLAKLIGKPEIPKLSQRKDAIPDRNAFKSINKLFPPGKIESPENSGKLEECQGFVKKEPWNPHAHLALAKIYEGKGEKQKATAEYFLVAEIFLKNSLYPHALAIYKQIEKSDPSLDMVLFKIADVYQKMGLLDDAFSQYSQLLHHYNDLGRKDKSKEILALMAHFEQKNFRPDEKAYVKYRLMKESSGPQEEERGRTGFSGEETERFFDLNAELEASKPIDMGDEKKISVGKIYGYGDILKELKKSGLPDKVHPNFYYHLGLACLEMGFINEAIDQFQIAIEKGQNPLESARLLGTCFTQKGSQDLHWQPPKTSRKVEVKFGTI